MLNDCNFIGFLGQDPELKHGQSGTAFCTFSIAVNKGSGDQKETTWINVTTFGKTAEFSNQYLRKGSLSYVKGELKIEKYTKDGVEHIAPKIIAYRVVPLSRVEGVGKPASEQTASVGGGTTSSNSSAGISSDDIPF